MAGTMKNVDLRRVGFVGAIGGMLAGMMVAMVEMLYGLASAAHTVLGCADRDLVVVAGIEHFCHSGNHVGPIVPGIGGHMMNSMVAGLTFAAILSVIRLRRARTGDAGLPLGPRDETVHAAIDEGVPANVLSAALYARFGSRGEADFADRVLPAMRLEFGGR